MFFLFPFFFLNRLSCARFYGGKPSGLTLITISMGSFNWTGSGVLCAREGCDSCCDVIHPSTSIIIYTFSFFFSPFFVLISHILFPSFFNHSLFLLRVNRTYRDGRSIAVEEGQLPHKNVVTRREWVHVIMQAFSYILRLIFNHTS